MSTNADTKSNSEDAGEESPSSSSNLSPLTSQPCDYRAALDAFRNDWQREIDASKTTKATVAPTTQINKDHSLAMNLFRQAVELEQSGKVYDALPFYRRAVQIMPDIELAYYKQQQLKSGSESREHKPSNQTVKEVSESEVVENLLDKFEADIDKHYNGRLILSNRDPGVISTSLHISDLPTELLLYILQWVISDQLDVRSLENCAAVCKGFYLCARDEEIWRLACAKVWGTNLGTLEGSRLAPTNDENENPSIINMRYPSWRHMFMDRERVLFHGCYISKTSYLRMGENSFQDQYYRPIQLVEYYRYLRFLPNGTAVMMTTADDPQSGVNKLVNINQVRSDVKKGEYVLNGSMISLVFDNPEPQTQNTRRQKRGNQLNEGKSSTKYQLELKICSTNKRKFCKLVWVNYSIVITRNDITTVTQFDVTPAKYPAYRFAAVRSFHLDSDAPLS